MLYQVLTPVLLMFNTVELNCLHRTLFLIFESLYLVKQANYR